MKKKILMVVTGFLMLIFLNACPLIPDPKCACVPPEPPESYLRLNVDTEDIKDSRVKNIKITLQNLDKVAPQYSISIGIVPKEVEKYPKEISGIQVKQINGIHTLTIKREKYIEVFKKIVYFPRSVITLFYQDYDKTDTKKRRYELKMYLNDKLFFTKKFSFIPEIFNIRGADIKFDNMDYVNEKYPNKDIKVTDADVKKFLKK